MATVELVVQKFEKAMYLKLDHTAQVETYKPEIKIIEKEVFLWNSNVSAKNLETLDQECQVD